MRLAPPESEQDTQSEARWHQVDPVAAETRCLRHKTTLITSQAQQWFNNLNLKIDILLLSTKIFEKKITSPHHFPFIIVAFAPIFVEHLENVVVSFVFRFGEFEIEEESEAENNEDENNEWVRSKNVLKNILFLILLH